MLMANILTKYHAARTRAFLLTGFAPIHRRGRATADALQAVGLAGVVLPIMAQGTHRVGGADIAPPPSQGWSEHPGAGHDAPMVWDLGPNRHVAAGQPHPLLPHLDDDVAVRRLLDDRIPGAAAEDVRHVVRTAGPTERDAHGR